MEFNRVDSFVIYPYNIRQKEVFMTEFIEIPFDNTSPEQLERYKELHGGDIIRNDDGILLRKAPRPVIISEFCDRTFNQENFLFFWIEDSLKGHIREKIRTSSELFITPRDKLETCFGFSSSETMKIDAALMANCSEHEGIRLHTNMSPDSYARWLICSNIAFMACLGDHTCNYQLYYDLTGIKIFKNCPMYEKSGYNPDKKKEMT